MRSLAAIALLAAVSCVPCLAQAVAPPPEAQTLQAILTELRSIHEDVRLSQTTQILLAELQMQQSAVTRARQRRDDLRTRSTQLQAQEKTIAAEVARMDDQANATLDPVVKKQLQDNEDRMKMSLPTLKLQDQQNTNDLQDAEAQLSREQDALDNIQGQLDAVVKQLQPAKN